jgi:hypothetical protein
MNTWHLFSSITLITCALTLTGCDELSDVEDRGEGKLVTTLYGESFIEEGITAEEMADGWSVTFDRFIVTLGELRVGGTQDASVDPIDISQETSGEGQSISSVIVPVGEYSDASFTITRIAFSGSASRGDLIKTFDWVFEQETHYSHCEAVTRVEQGETSTFQITIHADHFFYDSLVSETPQVVFQALADADLDGDGEITRAELEVTDIGGYDSGSAGEVNDMWAWLSAQSRTLGHVNGEGHCDAHVHPR